MFKIEEEKSPLYPEKSPFLPKKIPRPRKKSLEPEELSFGEISANSSEIDEKESRILQFLEDEDITMANPKEKAWEYAEKIKGKLFISQNKSELQKRFTLDNADLFNKRRASCMELGSKFFSPDINKNKSHQMDINTPKASAEKTNKNSSNFRKPLPYTHGFHIKALKNEENDSGSEKEPSNHHLTVPNEDHHAKKHKTSPILKEFLKDLKIGKR